MSTIRQDLEFLADLDKAPDPRGSGPMILVIIGCVILILISYGCR